MSKENFKKAVDEIKVDEEIINKTRKKLRDIKGGNVMSNRKRSFLAMACSLVLILLVMFILTQVSEAPIHEGPEMAALPKVESLEKLKEILEKNQNSGGRYYNSRDVFDMGIDIAAGESVLKEAAPIAQVEGGHSDTNVQVKGVDEADIVKTDGKYIYYVTTSKVIIVNAENPNDLKIVSEIKYSNDNKENFNPQELYIGENRLVVIGNKYVYNNNPSTRMMYQSGESYAVALIYDTTNKIDVKHIRNVETEGYYISSRMIDNNIYMISNKYIYAYHVLNDGIDPRPLCKDTVVSQEAIAIDYKDISYFPESEDTSYLMIAGFNINNNEKADIQTYLGAGSTIYSSQENMYIVRGKYTYHGFDYGPMSIIAPSAYEVSTEIYKFGLNNGKTEFKCKNTVPGNILNQFSMDEHNGNFRIATTDSSGNWISDNSVNNLYILDKDLNIIGTLEGLAKGERIYSVRFMGDRAYIVTFKQVDPLFVIDVSNPKDPKVLGELKIPGFSEYLHPYSENLIIGIGQDAETTMEYYGERTLTTGMKMALFDVTDPNNPKELFSTKIGDRGTYSEVLNNHKAFLFSKEKDIISFPITVTQSTGGSVSYGRTTFQGAIVYGLDLEKGFVEKGRIAHEQVGQGKSYYYYNYDKQVERILFIGDTLFTMSKGLIKSTNMNDMKEMDSLEITIEKPNYYEPYAIME